MTRVFLALACLALLLAIAAQDWLYAPLRNETISAGLTGHYHVLLDVSYVPLAVALWVYPWPSALMTVLAVLAGAALLIVAATNTAWRFFDGLTDGEHALWHSRFTIVVFSAALALQFAGDHGWRWALTVLNVAIPGAAYAYFHYRKTDVDGTLIAASPAAEKAFVMLLCVWLVAWTV